MITENNNIYRMKGIESEENKWKERNENLK